MLLVLMIAASLALAAHVPATWRTVTALVTAALLWHPLRTLIFLRGPWAVRRLCWESDGGWWIVQGNGLRREVSLHPATAALGPWLVLVWSASPGFGARRSYALIDAACANPVTFRALRGRLKLHRRRRPERRGRPVRGGN